MAIKFPGREIWGGFISFKPRNLSTAVLMADFETSSPATTNTVQNIAQGAATTFTVSPLIGYSASVGGTCGGTLAGNTYTTNAITAACTVAATFTLIPMVPPGAPVIGAAIPGDTTASVTFSPPASGGAPNSYTATCGSITANGTQSPITVTGLNNGMLYSCSVTATNSAGTGPASAAVDVTPTASAPLALIAVQSRRTHTGAGGFDLKIDHLQPVAGPVSVEPRMIGSGHLIVFQFNVPVSSVSSVAAEDAMTTPYPGVSHTISGNEVVVTLTGIADGQRATVTLAGVTANNATSLANVPTSLGFLVGDVNQSRAANAADISAVKARASPTVSTANFRFDLNASGAIDAADISAAKARAGLVIP